MTAFFKIIQFTPEKVVKQAIQKCSEKREDIAVAHVSSDCKTIYTVGFFHKLAFLVDL